MPDLKNVTKALREISDYFFNMYRLSTESYETAKAKDRCDAIEDALALLKEQEPRVMTLDEAAAAHEVWAEVWLSVPKKYVIVVTVLYLTDDCKNFELELLGTNKKAFMLTEAYGHTWRCWTARPTEDQRLAVKWDD